MSDQGLTLPDRPLEGAVKKVHFLIDDVYQTFFVAAILQQSL